MQRYVAGDEQVADAYPCTAGGHATAMGHSLQQRVCATGTGRQSQHSRATHAMMIWFPYGMVVSVLGVALTQTPNVP